MENGTVKRRCSEIVVAKILVGNFGQIKTVYFEFSIRTKQVYYLLTLLVAWIGRLLFAFFCQLLFQAAFTIAMHGWLIPVLTKVFGYVVFIGIILTHYHNLVKGL